MRRILALLLSLALALSLCACGKKDDPASPEGEALSSGEKEGWSMHYLPLPGGLAHASGMCAGGTYLYLAGVGSDGHNAVGRYDGESFSPYEVPEDLEALSDCFPTGDGGLGVLGGPSEYDWISEHDIGEPCPKALLLYDGEGKLLSRQDLTPALEEVKRLGRVKAGPDGVTVEFDLRAAAWFDGCLYLAGDQFVFQLDGDLQICRTFSGFSTMLSFISSPPGSAGSGLFIRRAGQFSPGPAAGLLRRGAADLSLLPLRFFRWHPFRHRLYTGGGAAPGYLWRPALQSRAPGRLWRDAV